MKYLIAALGALAFAVAMYPSAYLAHAEGEQVMGTMPCPLGMDWITVSIGGRPLAQVCMATAELERAVFVHGPEKGTVACHVLYVRGK